MHSGGLTKCELDSFQGAIAQRLGLRFDDSRSSLLLEVLARRVAARGQTRRSYLAALQQGTEPCDELGELARELTVGETYFLRHTDQFKALLEVALPERLSARAASRRLRLLSAGCASGEEAYSLSILLRQQGIELDYQVTIQGLDINPDALAKAAQGLYSPWSLRETPAHLTERWFVKEGRDFRLARALRDSVQFQQHNLISSSTKLLPDHSYDIVFCRNVLMYFTPGHATTVVEHLARALAPGGFLFLGHAETLRAASHAFHLRNTHGTFYYQRRSEDDCLDESSHFTAAASAMRSRAEPSDS